MKTFLSSLILMGIAVVVAAAGPPPMNPGKWQITMQTITPVMTDPSVTTVCISPDDAAAPSAPKTPPDADCKVASAGLGPQNSLDYTIACGKANVNSSAHFAYSGDHFEGTLIVTPADGHPIVQKISGVRIDTCPVPVPVVVPAPH